MQQVWGSFYQCEEYGCMLYEHLTSCVFFSKCEILVRICDVLVPIFHVPRGIGTKSSQYEIYGV